jgi:hypothetical protein
MNKKAMFALPLVALALVSCNTTKTSSSSSADTGYQMKWLTPTGTPTIAFYDQGANTNWETTATPGTKIVPAFAAGAVDAIVFDGVSGLNAIKKNGFNYKLGQWISEGNFYVVSTQHKAGDAFVSGQTIEGFVKTGNSARAFTKLASDQWHWNYAETDVTWLTGVAEVGQILMQSPKSFDYFIVAEPTLTMAKGALAKDGVTLNVVYDLQAEWKKAYNGNIPAAALFINNNTYASNKDAVTSFISAAQLRLDTAISSPDKVKTALNAYGNDAAVQQRFGYTASTAVSLQYNGANKFGLLKSGAVSDLVTFGNAFQTTLGGTAFDSSLFLS